MKDVQTLQAVRDEEAAVVNNGWISDMVDDLIA